MAYFQRNIIFMYFGYYFLFFIYQITVYNDTLLHLIIRKHNKLQIGYNEMEYKCLKFQKYLQVFLLHVSHIPT